LNSYNKAIDALDELMYKIETEPAFVAGIQGDIELMVIQQENRFDSDLSFLDNGDWIANAASPGYLGFLLEELYLGSYSRHGNGD